jgi:hypothetical protein
VDMRMAGGLRCVHVAFLGSVGPRSRYNDVPRKR